MSSLNTEGNVPGVDANSSRILVVGAGPVGLLTALRLAQAGIQVDLLEKEIGLSDAPRAAGYFAGALLALKKAQVLRKVMSLGFVGQGLAWRKPLVSDGRGGKRLGDVIARLKFPKDDSTLDGTNAIVYLRQSELSKLLLAEVLDTGLVKVHFDTTLVALRDDGDSVEATARGLNGEEVQFKGAFLVGTDGGKSTTRKLLEIPFKGHTWPERILAVDVLMEEKDLDPEFPTSMIIDTPHFGLIMPLEKPRDAQPVLYRCSVALDPKDSRPDDQLLSEEHLRSFLEVILPGPRPIAVPIVRSAIYRTHQRCASTMRRGNCLLAGDAAHLNNPWGGLGLTTGLLDAEAVADTIELIVQKGMSRDILNIYSDSRRRIFQTFVDPMSTQNKIRVDNDPERATEDWFLRSMLNPDPHKLKEFHEPFFTVWRTNMQALVESELGVSIDSGI